jgi:hypothetical protein
MPDRGVFLITIFLEQRECVTRFSAVGYSNGPLARWLRHCMTTSDTS